MRQKGGGNIQGIKLEAEKWHYTKQNTSEWIRLESYLQGERVELRLKREGTKT